MTVLSQKQYGDPLKVLLRKEGETCRGCVQERVIDAWGGKAIGCKLPGLVHGKRCDEYEEKPN